MSRPLISLIEQKYISRRKAAVNLVDADLGRESAKLKALMVREDLGLQALAIANEAPRTILRFFQ